MVTLQDIKSYLKIDDTNTKEDSFINNLIPSSYQMFCKYVGYEILSKDYTEYYSGDYTPNLIVKHVLINSITRLEIYGRVIDSTNYVIQGNEIILTDGTVFPLVPNQIKIIYNAGYDELPDDIKELLIEFIGIRYKYRDNINVLSMGNSHTRTTYEQDSIPDKIRKLLFFHRRVSC